METLMSPADDEGFNPDEVEAGITELINYVHTAGQPENPPVCDDTRAHRQHRLRMLGGVVTRTHDYLVAPHSPQLVRDVGRVPLGALCPQRSGRSN